MQESSAASQETEWMCIPLWNLVFFSNDVQCPGDVHAWWFKTILTTYTYMIVGLRDHCYATHNPSKLAAHNFAIPARLGRLGPYDIQISLIQKIGRKIWADICSSFKLLTPKCIGYRRPIQRQRYHKASAILNSVSHHTHKIPVVIFI